MVLVRSPFPGLFFPLWFDQHRIIYNVVFRLMYFIQDADILSRVSSVNKCSFDCCCCCTYFRTYQIDFGIGLPALPLKLRFDVRTAIPSVGVSDRLHSKVHRRFQHSYPRIKQHTPDVANHEAVLCMSVWMRFISTLRSH